MNAKQLYEVAENLFGKKAPLNSLWQEIADNFYAERADFTAKRNLGTDFAANVTTSYPMQCRRNLQNQFGTMLRPTARPWFHVGIRSAEPKTNSARAFLEWMEETQRMVMYDPPAMFLKASKQGDGDMAAFGQYVMSVELNSMKNGLVYRTWHLRDVCWSENENGAIGSVFRKWKPTAQTLCRTFKNHHQKASDQNSKDPFCEMECIHMVVDAEMYDEPTNRPRWSIWYDVANNHVMEAVPIWNRHYIIPRWQTVSDAVYGSQYSYSPATVIALPDARLLQAMTYTLLEAGEKATSPPMVATQDAVRSDVALFAGGITWVDNEYDERLGEALRPITQDFRGLNYGLQMNADTRAMIHSAFYLDALTLPQRAPDMTAYEVSQRVQEYIRNALPIFEPLEAECNAAVCMETFDLIRSVGGFGPEFAWPKELQGREINFTFESPLHDAIAQQKTTLYQQAQSLVGQAIALDPSCAYVPKAEVALRDALEGAGVPAEWLNSEQYVDDAKRQAAAAAEQQQRLASIQQGSEIAKNIGQSGMVQQPAVA